MIVNSDLAELSCMQLVINQVPTVDDVMAAGHLFDEAPSTDLTADFLARAGHHLLIASVDGEPAGFVSGVEIAHPDKRVEMFVYELGVDEAFRRRGVATALLRALDDVAESLRCRGSWVITEPDNVEARATYAKVGAEAETSVVYEWAVPRH